MTRDSDDENELDTVVRGLVFEGAVPSDEDLVLVLESIGFVGFEVAVFVAVIEPGVFVPVEESSFVVSGLLADDECGGATEGTVETDGVDPEPMLVDSWDIDVRLPFGLVVPPVPCEDETEDVYQVVCDFASVEDVNLFPEEEDGRDGCVDTNTGSEEVCVE